MSTSEPYRGGMAAYNTAHYEQAIELLEPLATGTEANQDEAATLLSRFYLGQAHHRLALRHLRQMRFKEAAGHFEQAARLNPSGGGVERFLATCHARTGRYDLALRDLEAILERQPDDVDARVRLALTQWKQSAPEQAMQTLADGIAVRVNAGFCEAGGHRAHNAPLERERPGQAELLYQLGVMHAAREDFDRAEECFASAVRYDTHHAAAHERLAQCCSLRGDYQQTIDLLRRAAALEPRNANIGRQISLLAQGIPGAARALLSGDEGHINVTLDRTSVERLGDLIAGEPDFVDAFLSLPDSQVDREVFSALAATLEHALTRHPEYADLHYHCGEVYRRLGRNADAIAHAERAVRINPRYVNALILLAGLYAQTQRETDGVQRLEEAIHLGGDDADVHYMLGQLYQKTGQAGRARDAFQRALALNGNLQAAKDALNSLATAGM